jgi:hypothetical protein
MLKRILFLGIISFLLVPSLSYAINVLNYEPPNGYAKQWYDNGTGKYSTDTHIPYSKTINGVIVNKIQTTIGGVVTDESYGWGLYIYGGKSFNQVGKYGLYDMSMTCYPPYQKLPSSITVGQTYNTSTSLVWELCPHGQTSCLSAVGVIKSSAVILGYESIKTPIGDFSALKIKQKFDITITDSTDTINDSTKNITYLVKGVGSIKKVDLYDGSTSVVVATSFSIPFEAGPGSDKLSIDPSFYLSKNPDLKAAGYSNANAQDHWFSSGIYEGRQASSVFDVKYYLQANPDLQSMYGKNYYGAYQHWVYNGIKEGRPSSRVFKVKFYLKKYPDLQKKFGDDYQLAYEHFSKSGLKEGRQGSAAFSAKYYLQQNQDLKKIFGTNYKAACIHWLNYGIKEGRKCAP